jgi:hypothetical protein
MKVFNPTNLVHKLIVIPRFYQDITNISIRHELTDKIIIVTDFTNSIDNGYLTISFEFTFKDNASYEIIVNGIDNLLWRGKGFATIETNLENYKIL